jgi:PKD repeat protein
VYNVTLIAANNFGCTDTFVSQLAITPSPIADFSYIINGNTINFTDLTTINAGIIYWSWNFDNLGSSQQQHPSFTFPGNGAYEVCLSITSDQWCYDSVCKTILITGMNEKNQLEYVQVFPNPFSEQLNIKNIFSETAEVKITNSLSEVVFTKITKENALEIDLKNLPTGFYFLSVLDNSGNIFTQKLIK